MRDALALTAPDVSSSSLSLSWLPLQAFTGDFLYLAVIFFVLAIVAALVGARGVAGLTMEAAKWFIIIFVVLAIISLLL